MDDGGVSEERYSRGGGNGCLKGVIALAILLAAIGAGFWFLGQNLIRQFAGGPDPTTVVQSSLKSLQEENRLISYSASFTAATTADVTHYGLSAQKTMVMSGTVRYEIDLSKLSQKDVQWNAATHTLTVNAPEVQPSEPQIDINNIHEYGGGGLLTALTDTGKQLSDANRVAAQKNLSEQAQAPAIMRLARDSARRSIAHSFELPLHAAGVNATVEVYFPGEAHGQNTEVWDASRRPEDVIANKW
jgi:hypothetical protein